MDYAVLDNNLSPKFGHIKSFVSVAVKIKYLL